LGMTFLFETWDDNEYDLIELGIGDPQFTGARTWHSEVENDGHIMSISRDSAIECRKAAEDWIAATIQGMQKEGIKVYWPNSYQEVDAELLFAPKAVPQKRAYKRRVASSV
jgi:hypothetical protein